MWWPVPGEISLFVRTFIIGIAVAAPVGAMGVLCIQRTLDRGWRAGIATGLGIATADGIYAGFAAFGVTALSQALVAWQTPLQLVGGAALVYLGVRSMAAQRPRAADQNTIDPADCDGGVAASRQRSARSHYASAVALTLTNPMTIMAFGAVFASAGLTAEPTFGSAGVATLGVVSGSSSWWIGLTALVVVFRHGLGDGLVVWVRRLSGFVIVGFGVLALAIALT